LAEFSYEKSAEGARGSNPEIKAGEYQQGREQIQRRRGETQQVQKINASVPENTYWERVSGQL
jgi:hypothetical protein